jgi:hypothetical protein
MFSRKSGGVPVAFEAFFAGITAEPLKQVARHWAAVRGTRAVPGWRDLRPSAIAAQLPILWSWKYDAELDQFTGRLAGDAIERIFGHSFRDANMREMFPIADYERFFVRHKRVVLEPALFHGHGLVFQGFDRYGVGERIILPLSDSGGACDGIVGATLYESAVGTPPEAAIRNEVEEWFAIG